MLVQLKNRWLYQEKKPLPEVYENFFKEYGKWDHTTKEVDINKKENDEEVTVKETRHDYDFRFVGEIDAIPIEILNSGKIELEFFNSGLKVLSEKVGMSQDKFEASKNNITIHMPSNELISMNSFTWIEDACTEELQRMIDDGYRVVSCIPQVGNRRPDYVLGKIKRGNNE